MDKDDRDPDPGDEDRYPSEEDRHLPDQDRPNVAADSLEPLLDVLAEIAFEALYDDRDVNP